MHLDLDFLTVLFGILNHGLEMCCVCRTDITVLQHCLWHLIEGESWAPRDNLLQLGRKGREQNWHRGHGNKQQLLRGIGQAGKEV